MTVNDLVVQLTPKVQEAAERAKPDILSSLSPVYRVLIKTIWPFAMKRVVPLSTRVTLEFLIVKYRRDVEPTLGPWVDILIKSIDEEQSPGALKMIRDILDVLHTPSSEFHHAVRECLNPNLSHDFPPYSKSR